MNDNSVELIDYMGSDKLHSLAAWSSTFLEFGVDSPDNPHLRVDQLVDHILNNGKKKRSVQDLIEYLAANSHTSPFRFSSFIFGMTTDICTHYQKLKHKVLLEAENGESGRYKELKEDKMYIPTEWGEIPLNPTEMSPLGYMASYGQKTWGEALENHSILGNALYHDALKQITPVLGKQRAKETSRYFKGLNSQLNTLNKLSFDGVVQFYKKRADTAAQKEIAVIAAKMVELIKNIPGNPFKYSLKAFKL